MPRPRSATPQHSTLHAWIRRNYPKSGICDHCGQEKRTTYATVKDAKPYSRDRDDYLELCYSCHAIYDGCSPEESAKRSESKKAYYAANPGLGAQHAAHTQTPEAQAKRRASKQTPEHRAKMREAGRKGALKRWGKGG